MIMMTSFFNTQLKYLYVWNKNQHSNGSDKALRFVSKNYPIFAWSVDMANWGKIRSVIGIFQHFKLRRGLCGEVETVSFESVKSPGCYLRQTKNYWVMLNRHEDNESYKKDASFRPVMDAFHKVCCSKIYFIYYLFLLPIILIIFFIFIQGFVSFESVNWSGYFIRHSNYWLKVETGTSNLFQNDASFSISKKYIEQSFNKKQNFYFH